jgi:hypothetical protein
LGVVHGLNTVPVLEVKESVWCHKNNVFLVILYSRYGKRLGMATVPERDLVMLRVFLLLPAVILLSMPCGAVPDGGNTMLPPEFEVHLSKQSIVSCEPVDVLVNVINKNTSGSLFISIRNNISTQKQVLALSLKDRITNSEMPRRELKFYPATQMFLAHYLCIPAESRVTISYPLHLQYSTDLPPGNYSLFFASMKAVFSRCLEEPSTTIEPCLQEMSLAVLSYDRQRLEQAYGDLEKSAIAESDAPARYWTGMDFQLGSAVRSVLWAYGPDAVKSQLNLLFDEQKGFRFPMSSTAHTWDNIARFASLDNVRKMAHIAENPRFCSTLNQPGPWFNRGLIWALYELNGRGDPDIFKMTRPFLDRFSQKPDLNDVERFSLVPE